MKKVFLPLVCVAALLASTTKTWAASSVQPSTSPSATVVVDSRIMAKAKEWFRRFQTGKIDRSQLSSRANADLTDAAIQREAAALKPFGNPSSFLFDRSYPISGAIGYDFILQFKAGRIIEMIAFDMNGKIAGIDFQTFVPSGK